MAEPDLGALIADRFVTERRELVAFVGGGGKTTLLLALGRALAAQGRRVLLTTTTRVGAWQVEGLELEFLSAGVEAGKLVGLAPDAVDRLFAERGADVLVEADGSRHRVVKAPAPHEPVIPSSTTLVVAVLGADGLNRVIEDVAHRPMRVAAAAGCGPYERLTPERAARLLASPTGLRKGVPAGARYAVALTRVGPAERAAAGELSDALAARAVEVVVLPFVGAR